MPNLLWSSKETPKEIASALLALEEEYPISLRGRGHRRMSFAQVKGESSRYVITRDGDHYHIEYTTLPAALRAVGTILAGISVDKEEVPFSMYGIMLDCSRNAVMTVSYLKSYLCRLALLGYNTAMLYTEDTYQIPGEPYFGYMRGGYTAQELREIDDYADRLGIEMIPCIQTLGHLEQILRWSAYNPVKDTQRVMLADEPETYKLIERMIEQCKNCFRSQRIHVGMDETHDLGRGVFMDRYGYENGFNIFNRHLAKVVKLCKKHDRRAMIWSDMYFRLGSKTNHYYDKKSVIPEAVKAKIPADVELVYWDYYHHDEAFYAEWIKRHRALGKEPLMASGAWTWSTFWHRKEQTCGAGGACVRASKKAGLKEFLVTLWGDDGGYCDYDSAMVGLTWLAELAYGNSTDAERLQKRFAAICHSDFRTADAPTEDTLGDASLVWDDPILGIYYHNEQLKQKNIWQKRHEKFASLLTTFKKSQTSATTGGDFQYAAILTEFLLAKIDLNLKFRSAYAQRNTRQLQSSAKDALSMAARIKKLDAAFSRQWLRRNKPFGLEVIQIRFAGQRRRYEELAARIRQLLAGEVAVIEELENRPKTPLESLSSNFRNVAVGSTIY